MSKMEELKTYIEKRIQQLKEADTAFCAIRWDDSKSNMEKFAARDGSNEVTARRHELEEIQRTFFK